MPVQDLGGGDMQAGQHREGGVREPLGVLMEAGPQPLGVVVAALMAEERRLVRDELHGDVETTGEARSLHRVPYVTALRGKPGDRIRDKLVSGSRRQPPVDRVRRYRQEVPARGEAATSLGDKLQPRGEQARQRLLAQTGLIHVESLAGEVTDKIVQPVACLTGRVGAYRGEQRPVLKLADNGRSVLRIEQNT